ncbi:hypothetical protein CEXT_695771 [Caerostris extrusa]|uniref:Uncharacterized protein n=1 Tax=Caerostris extrusa TaxID=172846 RepID=A0AAV4Q0T8_CAEEX|nr:hypothetical protein CEXT_695771 [Caerostris extrusa]
MQQGSSHEAGSSLFERHQSGIVRLEHSSSKRLFEHTGTSLHLLTSHPSRWPLTPRSLSRCQTIFGRGGSRFKVEAPKIE